MQDDAASTQTSPPDGPRPSLRRQVVVGAGWMTGLQLLSKVIEIGFVAVLARLLTPADFGVIAGATMFVQFTTMLVEIGIGATLVQLPQLSRNDIRVAGTLVFMNAVLYAFLTVVLAPLAAKFIDIPAVEPVLRILSLVFIIQAFGIVAENLLVRDIKVKQVMLAQLGARVVGTGVIGIGFAFAGFGYWSLVIATLAEVGLKALVLTAIVRPPFVPLLDKAIARKLMRKGSGFSASKLINFVALRADNAIVGRTMDAAALGLYSRAYNLMSVPADLYGRIAERIVFPAMAQVQDDTPRLRSAYLRGLELTAVFGMPLSALLAILAPEIIRVVLGEQWTAVIVPFAWLSAASYFRLGAKISNSLQRAKGAVGPMVTNQIAYAAMVIGGCLLTYPYGIVALSQAVALSVILFYIIVSVNACRLIQVSLPAFLRAHLPGTLLAALVGLTSYGAVILPRTHWHSPFAVLCVAGAVAGLFGIVLILARPRWLIGVALAELADTVLRKLRRRSGSSLAEVR